MRLLRGLLPCAAFVAVFALVAVTPATAAGATAAGTWSCCGEGGAAQQTWAITESGGSLSGTASDPEAFSPISGKISGTSVEIVTGPYYGSSYSATFVGTISGESMSGTWKSNVGQEGTWTATRTLSEEAARKKKEEEEKANALRKATIQVNCDNLELYSPSNYFQCTAQLADASGKSPAEAPTGTVEFAINPGGGGSFRGASSCALAPSQDGGATSFCAVDYLPRPGGIPVGEQPPIMAAYSGSSVFSPATGAPKGTVGTGSPEPGPSYKACAASPSQLALRIDPGLTGLLGGFNALTKRSLVAVEEPRATSATASRPTSVTVGTAPADRRGRTLTRRRADARALALLHPGKAPLAGGVKLYGLLQPARAGSVITEASPDPVSPLPALHIKSSAWLYWEDLGPGQGFMHPSVVLILSAKGGHVLARARFSTYPLLDGHEPAFLTARHPHVIYYRLPAPGHSARLTSSALKMLKAAAGLARKLAKKSVAHGADASKSQLVTLVSKAYAAESDTFENEETAMLAVFAAHGVDGQSTRTVAGLSSAVESATAAGKTDVTIYIDGHGLVSPAQGKGTGELTSVQPAVSLDLSGYVTRAEAEKSESVRADQLATIVQAHPDVHFNFIIDACYSGRFVEPLSAEPNVQSVTTSSSATQKSWGPMTIELKPKPASSTEPEGNEGRGLYTIKVAGEPVKVPEPAKVSTPDGDAVIVSDAKNPDAISPFTTAMVAAIDAGYTALGSDADVPAVIKYARGVEYEYDLAVADGLTTPSRSITVSPDPQCVPANTPEPEPTGGWFTSGG